MDANRDLIHKLLDGGISPEEEKEISSRIASDPVLQSELDALRDVVRAVESSERLTLPASFTSEVMKRLPERKGSRLIRARNFFFAERTLRWNIATAAATLAFFAVIISGVVFQLQNRERSMARDVSRREAVKTVSVSFYAPQARTVSVAGDFNKWSVDDGLMKKRENGTWTIEVPLKPGVYHYMFVVDGEGWVPDPKAESYRDDGFGNKNSVLRVDNI